MKKFLTILVSVWDKVKKFFIADKGNKIKGNGNIIGNHNSIATTTTTNNITMPVIHYQLDDLSVNNDIVVYGIQSQIQSFAISLAPKQFEIRPEIVMMIQTAYLRPQNYVVTRIK